MKAAPFNVQVKGGLEFVSSTTQQELKEALFWSEKAIGIIGEPRSVLDRRRSPSPPNSTSTLSSGGAVAAVSDTTITKWPDLTAGQKKEDWAHDLPPIAAAADMPFVAGAETWDAMLGAAAAGSPGQEQTFLHWIMGDVVDEPSALNLKPQHQATMLAGDNAGLGFGVVDPFGFSSMEQHHMSGMNSDVTSSSGSNRGGNYGNALFSHEPPPMFFQNAIDTKPTPSSLFGVPNLLLNQHQQPQQSSNPAFFVPLQSYANHVDHHHQLLPPTLKRHHSMPPAANLDPHNSQELFLLRNQMQQHQLQQPQNLPFPPPPHMKTKPAAIDQAATASAQQQLLDQLFEAAKATEAGNSIGAREILARLNHHLPICPPIGKPLLRSAFYFKEALLLALADVTNQTLTPRSQLSSPLDVAVKLGAYKSFSDLSPIVQFSNFTSTQALLDELGNAHRIHVFDFDLGVGGQWASFMQELAHRRGGNASDPPVLKVTAFVSAVSHHPLELHLTRENLVQFAADLGIAFEFAAVSLDSFDMAKLLAAAAGYEAVAVSIPVGTSARTPPLAALLRLVKQLSPKVVIAIDHGGDRGDLPFSQHFLHAFQSCMFLLDSLDSAGADPDVADKIERFLLQPRIEDVVLGRRRTEKMLSWRTLFSSAGYAPVLLSNLAEAQAECLLKRVPVRGFHLDKRGAALVLFWQRSELVSVSAWRC